MTATIAQIQLWDIIHRFCKDDPGEITNAAEAEYVSLVHAEHGDYCLQYVAAARVSEVLT